MILLANYIGGARGGINRRVHEMSKFFNSTGNRAGHRMIAVGIHDQDTLVRHVDANVTTYRLPFQSWHRFRPGAEDGVSSHLESFGRFRDHISETVATIGKIMRAENVDVCFAQSAFYSPWTVIAAAQDARVVCVQLYSGSTQTEMLNDEVRNAYLHIERRFAELPDHTLFNSRLGKEAMQRILGRSFASSPVIYNGFPGEYGSLAERVQERVGLGWAGRWAQVKRIDLLLRLRDLVDPEIPIHVQSDIPESSRDRFSMQGIVQHELVPPGRMSEFFARVTSVISTSCFEFCPNVIMEAISAGRVPIVSGASGAAELLRENGLDELVVDLDDMPHVARLIERSLEFQQNVKSVGDRLRMELSWPRVTDMYLDECEKALSGAGVGG